MDPAGLESLREGVKADLVATSLGEAVKLCIEATGMEDQSQDALQQEKSTTAVA
jgi:hypothetical protein